MYAWTLINPKALIPFRFHFNTSWVLFREKKIWKWKSYGLAEENIMAASHCEKYGACKIIMSVEWDDDARFVRWKNYLMQKKLKVNHALLEHACINEHLLLIFKFFVFSYLLLTCSALVQVIIVISDLFWLHIFFGWREGDFILVLLS